MTNAHYYGDNLSVLRESIATESVDLVYLDPPFNSNDSYNILFKAPSGEHSEAQIEAFEDTWHWNDSAELAFDEVVKGPHSDASIMLSAMLSALGRNDMMAYLAMMAVRLIELNRVLKPSGSLYLHCDPTASHYLKILLDAVFGPANFRNEIIWKRTSSHNRAKRWGPVHDTILFYSASNKFTWNRVLQAYDEKYTDEFYRYSDTKGHYAVDNLTGPGPRTGSSGLPWRGIDPTRNRRHWELPPDRSLPNWFVFPPGYAEMNVQDRLDVLDQQGLIYWPAKVGGIPRYKRYLESQGGMAVQDVITDIPPIQAHSQERLGYPTQKPLALLERIISASSNEGGMSRPLLNSAGRALPVDDVTRLAGPSQVSV